MTGTEPLPGYSAVFGPLGAALDQADCFFMCLDGRGVIRYVNPYGRHFFNRKPETLIGEAFGYKVLWQVPSILGDPVRLFRRMMKDPDQWARFSCDMWQEKVPCRFEWAITTVQDAAGKLREAWCVGVPVDTAAFRRAAQAPFHRLLESFIDTSRVWAFEIGAHRRFKFVSSGAKEMLGYAPSEMVGERAIGFMHSEDGPAMTKLIEEKFAAGENHFNMVHRSVTKEGRIVWVETTNTLFRDARGEFAGAIGFDRDITGEKLYLEALARREREYQHLYDLAQVAIAVTDENGVFRSLNQAVGRIWERPVEEMLGRSFTDFLVPEERDLAKEDYKRRYREAMATSGDLLTIDNFIRTIETPIGHKRIRFVGGAVKVNIAGRPAGLMLTAVDVTEQMRDQEDLRLEQEKLAAIVAEKSRELEALSKDLVQQRRLEVVGELAGMLDKEVQAPLVVVDEALNAIRAQVGGKDSKIDAAVDRCFRAISQCAGIVRDLAAVDGAPSGEFKIVNVMQRVSAWLADATVPEGVTVSVEGLTDIFVRMDEERLARCLSNLVNNAVQALSGETQGRIQIQTGTEAGWHLIRVVDNGKGIDPQHLSRLFEPLFSTKRTGIGLGLSICKQIMKEHRGRIDIDSRPGIGTTVTLRFPETDPGAPNEFD